MTTEQKLECVFCRETFEDKETLQIHFRKHGDPKFDIGTKMVKSKIHNESTSTSLHRLVDDNIEKVACDVCEEVFTTISKAITHKHKAHPDHDAKYFCPFCGKLFTMKHLHNKHIQSNHDSSEVTDSNDFHCESCNVSFYTYSAMMYHNKFFHRQDTELPAIGHSKKVKLNNQEMVQIYYCAFCGEEFNNKVNLHKHMSDDHGDENQCPNEVLRCPLCEAIFYHLDAYELHLTFHSTEDLYSETNELVAQITEFSLETVAPIVENVSDDDNTVTNTEEIGNFLQLVMGEQADDAPTEKIKHKKHKKHKKSKKATITLDEFLNMNKDVFGDGLGDIQGIEEVPTQVVLKKVKNKAQNKSESKVLSPDLARLKKQGIIIKTKSKKNTNNMNFNTHIPKQQSDSGISSEKHKATTSTEILSKLLNQGNSQIKIVKKTVPQNIVNETNVAAMSIDNSNEQNNMPAQSKDNIKEILNSIESPSGSKQFYAKSDITDDFEEKNVQTEVNDSNVNEKDINNKEERIITDSGDNCDSTVEKIKTSELSPDAFKNSSQEKLLESQDKCENSEADACIETHQHISLQKNNKFDDTTNYHDSDNEHEPTDSNKATISVLKHLSHLITVKPLVNQKKDTDKPFKSFDTKNEEKNYDNETHVGPNSSKNTCSDQNILSKNTCKNEQININPPKQYPISKSLDQYSNADNYLPSSNEIDDEKLSEIVSSPVKVNKNIIYMKELKVMLTPIPQSVYNKYLSRSSSTKNSDSPLHKQTITGEKINNDNPCKKGSNIDILKKLTNVTAKPINSPKIMVQQPRVNPCQSNTNQVKTIPYKKYSKAIDEDLEVYNIDDSDEDDIPLSNKAEVNKKNVSPLQNIPKNIIMKSNEIKTKSDVKVENNSGRSDTYTERFTQIKHSTEIQKSINLQNKLKNLGNITVKSKNSSPKVYNKNHQKMYDHYDDDDDDNYDDDDDEEPTNERWSDSENTSGVKITEVNEDDISENEYNDSQTNAVIESPHASNSENEDSHEKSDDDVPDLESQIKISALNKNKESTNLKAFKNFNKELTIKSINTKTAEQEPNVFSEKGDDEDAKNINNEMAMKLYKPNISQNENVQNKNIPQASGSTNQNVLTQKVNSSSNQVNTVKTVNTVKRFQSQTVIEEITTTVTKTIRTVNSSTNEVMQSTSQNTPKSLNKPQKIINKQPGKELQGTAVRHISPTIGTKIRNAVPLARTVNQPSIRPANPVVSMRPNFNRPRCPAPSTSAIRKVVPPKCVIQKPAIGKLKISPHALNQTQKRPSDDQIPNFKRLKNTSISPDMPDFNDDGSPMQSTMSQSRQDFSSVVKSVKSKGMFTSTQTRSEITQSQQQMSKGAAIATQMRSETSTCSQQQLSKLSNVSGLKVVKTSSKQSMQVEEKFETNPGNRNTLEALEKLQKQGLLIKKPRIEEYNDPVQPYSDSDDDEGEK